MLILPAPAAEPIIDLAEATGGTVESLSGTVFRARGTDSRPLSYRAARDILTAACARVGLPAVDSAALRAACAHRLRAQGLSDHEVAAVLAQPSGFRPEMPDLFYGNNIVRWGPPLCARRPEITMEMVDAFLSKMYRSNADFTFTVSRDFVRSCQTPMLILPDDVPAHPYAIAMEVANLAPNSEVSIYPWQDPKSLIPQAVSHVRDFLKKHRPVTAAR